MFECVVDEFLYDAEDVHGVLFVEGGFDACLGEVDGTASGSFHILAESMDAGLQGVFVHIDGHQPARDAADGLDDFEEVGVHGRDDGIGLCGVMLGPVEAVEVEAEDRQALDEVVVEVGAHFGHDLVGRLKDAAIDLRLEFGPGFEYIEHNG